MHVSMHAHSYASMNLTLPSPWPGSWNLKPLASAIRKAAIATVVLPSSVSPACSATRKLRSKRARQAREPPDTGKEAY